MRLGDTAINRISTLIFMLLTPNEILVTNLRMIHIYFNRILICALLGTLHIYIPSSFKCF